MAKRKDATKAVKPAAAPPPPPTTTTRTPPPPRSKPSPLRTFILLIRIASCCFALYVLWKRMHPPKDATDLAEDDKRVTFEEIKVDEVRRQAVLDAFKVRTGSMNPDESELTYCSLTALLLGLRA